MGLWDMIEDAIDKTIPNIALPFSKEKGDTGSDDQADQVDPLDTDPSDPSPDSKDIVDLAKQISPPFILWDIFKDKSNGGIGLLGGKVGSGLTMIIIIAAIILVLIMIIK